MGIILYTCPYFDIFVAILGTRDSMTMPHLAEVWQQPEPTIARTTAAATSTALSAKSSPTWFKLNQEYMKISRKMKSLDAKDIAESISKVMNESLIFTGDLFMQIVDSEKEEQED